MNDPRISMAKKCLGTIEHQRAKGIEGDLKVMRETLYSLSYYPDPMSIKDYLKISKYSLVASAFSEKLRRALPYEEKLSASTYTTLYCLCILRGLEARMELKDSLCMIDMFYGEVINTSKLIPGKLQLCLVDAGSVGSGYYGGHNLKVVTNDLGVKPGWVLPVALLPPMEVGGIISEGMFISTLNEKDKKLLVGTRPQIGNEAGPALGIIAAFAVSA